MTRTQAYQILTKYLTNKNLLKHSFAAEATMKSLYKRLTPREEYNISGEEQWGITGLLHDADYEMAKDHPEKHGLLLFEKEKDIPEAIAHAIKSHNYQHTKVMPTSKMDWAITACDQLTGLIVAAALVHPDRKLASINSSFVMNKMKSKSFAKGADRKAIMLCEKELNIPLEEFVVITLTAMQSISNELGL